MKFLEPQGKFAYYSANRFFTAFRDHFITDSRKAGGFFVALALWILTIIPANAQFSTPLLSPTEDLKNADLLNGDLSDFSETNESFSGESRIEKVASRAFDFTLSGTGNSDSAPSLAHQSIDGYQFDDAGQNRFIVPESSLAALPMTISADAGWKGPASDEGHETYILFGNCQILQGDNSFKGPKAVVEIASCSEVRPEEREVIVYLEKENQWTPLDLQIKSEYIAARTSETAWLGTFRTDSEVQFQITRPGDGELVPEEIYERAQAMKKSVETAPRHSSMPTYNNDNEPALSPETPSQQEVTLTSKASDKIENLKQAGTGDVKFRKISLLSRYDRDLNARSESDPTNPSRNRYIISGGFILMIEGIAANGETISDVIDISADHAVIWAGGIDLLSGGGEKTQSQDQDLEIYMEGDIIFREGERIVYAQKMYYDARNQVGLIKDTEMMIPLPETAGGLFRINAETVSQNGPDTFKATNTWFSTSAMGEPSYRLQSNSLTAEFRKAPLYDAATGEAAVNPETGDPIYDQNNYVIAENNFVAFDNVPVFYWPWMSMDLKNRSLYMRHFQVGSDGEYGTQVRTGWNPYQIFNLNKYRPEGTDWTIDLDYLSKRGLGHGTTFVYNRDSIGCWETQTMGMANFYGISDKGTDNLGLGRREVSFPNKYRYRGIWKHKQSFDLGSCLGKDWLLTAQFGKSSDRNYIPEYFEEEWFTNANPETSLEIKKTVNNWSISGYTSVLTDDFYTGTNWLPRLDHYWIGQPLFCNKLLWYEHTDLGFAQFRTADTPYAAEDQALFRYLDWELDPTSTSNVANAAGTKTLSSNSFNFATRNELDVPLNAGPVKVTPYALGEYAFWGEGMTQSSISRLYGRGGVRANLPVWKVNSDVSSRTWYLNGLAHKMNFAVDAYYSAANKEISDLILYNQLDDWQVEDFRRQYSVTTFSNTYSPYRDSIPVRFDERYYALRQGELGGAVTSPSTEIAGDLTQVRFDWFNRWQTKRGPMGNRHTVDWITFDTGFGLYPKKEQNYEEILGLVDYDARWHVGDRFSVLSSGLFDFFDSGQQIVRAGVMSKRPGVSSFYLGADRLYGPINNTYLNAAINYRMSQKWAASVSNSYDLSEGRNVGQEFGISRIGESFLWTLKMNINQSKDNWGISLNVLPIFFFDNKKFEEDILGFGQM